jgi:hypothetical protein
LGANVDTSGGVLQAPNTIGAKTPSITITSGTAVPTGTNMIGNIYTPGAVSISSFRQLDQGSTAAIQKVPTGGQAGGLTVSNVVRINLTGQNRILDLGPQSFIAPSGSLGNEFGGILNAVDPALNTSLENFIFDLLERRATEEQPLELLNEISKGQDVQVDVTSVNPNPPEGGRKGGKSRDVWSTPFERRNPSQRTNR